MNSVKILFPLFVFYFLYDRVNSQGGCIQTYTDFLIDGNDLSNVAGKSSDCCAKCQGTQGCRAYTWNSTNGGTCFLKSANYPLAKDAGSFTGIMAPTAAETYGLVQNFAYPNFFNNTASNWHFSNWALSDSSWIVNEDLAWALGLIGYQNEKVYLGADHKNNYNHTGKRPTIQMPSTFLYTRGLYILSLDHMPAGLGVWPSWWFTGDAWPNDGEVDVIEGVGGMNNTLISIVNGHNCTQRQDSSKYFTGVWIDHVDPVNCNNKNKIPDNCHVYGPSETWMDGFNANGGGVWAFQWTNEFFRIWAFTKANIPADIVSNSPNPNPATWGQPTALYFLGDNCPPENFFNHTMVFDVELCGSWADQYYPGGAYACEDAVKNQPSAWAEAYWLINYVKVFCQPGDNGCGIYEPICEFGC